MIENETCPTCHGLGAITCLECQGTGWVAWSSCYGMRWMRTPLGVGLEPWSVNVLDCPSCRGSKTVHRINPVSPILTDIPSLHNVQPPRLDLRDTGLKPTLPSPSKSLIEELFDWFVLVAIGVLAFLLINAVLRLIS